MTSEEQLRRWLAGEAIHNQERDECCPDFSCCAPVEIVSLGERQRFYDAFTSGDEDVIMEMLGSFLIRTLEAEGFEVRSSADV